MKLALHISAAWLSINHCLSNQNQYKLVCIQYRETSQRLYRDERLNYSLFVQTFEKFSVNKCQYIHLLKVACATNVYRYHGGLSDLYQHVQQGQRYPFATMTRWHSFYRQFSHQRKKKLVFWQSCYWVYCIKDDWIRLILRMDCLISA